MNRSIQIRDERDLRHFYLDARFRSKFEKSDKGPIGPDRSEMIEIARYIFVCSMVAMEYHLNRNTYIYHRQSDDRNRVQVMERD